MIEILALVIGLAGIVAAFVLGRKTRDVEIKVEGRAVRIGLTTEQERAHATADKLASDSASIRADHPVPVPGDPERTAANLGASIEEHARLILRPDPGARDK